MRRISTVLVVAGTLALGACGGGESSFAGADRDGTTFAAKHVPVVLEFALPRAGKAHVRHAMYVSAATAGIAVDVTSAGGAMTTATGTCGATTCTATFAAAPGPATLVVKLSDASGAVLSRATTNVLIAPAEQNVFSLTANPVVAGVFLQLAATNVTAGAAADIALTLTARDAANRIIVGSDAFVDASGAPLTLTLQSTNAQAGGSGAVSITGGTTFTALPASPLQAHYNGKWLDHATLSVDVAGGTVAANIGTTLTTTPAAMEYPITGTPYGIVPGADGRMWFAEFGANKVGVIDTAGNGYTEYPCAGCVQPHYVSIGSDGNVWFTEYGGSHVDKISTAGVVTRVAALPGYGVAAVLGPDGSMWSSSDTGMAISRTTSAGASASFTTVSSGQPRGMNFAPDGTIWYLDMSANRVQHVTNTGAPLGFATVPNLGGPFGSPCPCSDSIVPGPDGNMWFVDYGSSLIESVTPSGVVTPHALSASAGPRGIVAGPDGALWFTETNAGKIGRIDPSSGALTEYGAASGISPGSGPLGITVGSDGNIWFTEQFGNRVGKIVL